MPAKEKREFDEAKRLEISLTEDRKQALALMAARFGRGEVGWEKAHELGGCHPNTYRQWDDDALNVQPRDQSFKKTAVALGMKYGFHE